MRNQLFIAYSHRDAKWLDTLKLFLKPLWRDDQIYLQDDRNAGMEGIKESLASAKVCVLLVSDNFLASDLMVVLPKLLDAASRKGMIITWVPVSPSPVRETEIYKYQAAINPAHPLNTLASAKRNIALAHVVVTITYLLEYKKPPAAKRVRATKAKPTEPKPARAARKSPAKSAAKPVAVEPEAKRTFVCYAREDESFALGFASDLKDGGVNVWVDQWDIPSGADWDYEIDKALYDCHYFLIVLSPAAVESEEVRSELRIALDERKRIVPVLYQPCRVPRRLRLIQHIDCTEAAGGRSDRAMRLILRALGR